MLVGLLGDHVHDHGLEGIAGDAVHGVVGVTKELDKIIVLHLIKKSC